MANSPSLNKKVLLFGARGMVGSALAHVFAGPGLVSYSHQDLDITDYVRLEKSFLRNKPDIVLNAAAFTRVDDCERLRETAYLVNALAPGHIASFCKRYNALMVHLSTDYIFDGESQVPYDEDHPPNPVNYYGSTKLEAEKKILASGCNSLILRTSWIFGKNGDNFVKKILKRALAGATLQAVLDQTGTPTHSEDVAAAIYRLLSIDALGIFHFTNSGQCTRYEQAAAVLNLYGLNNPVEAATNDDLRMPAKRPRYSVLDHMRYQKATGHLPRTWQQSTAEYISYLKQNEHELRS